LSVPQNDRLRIHFALERQANRKCARRHLRQERKRLRLGGTDKGGWVSFLGLQPGNYQVNLSDPANEGIVLKLGDSLLLKTA
jgi:hypothetical protein